MIRAVVDPSVLVSAFIGNPDAAPGRLVTAWSEHLFVLIACPELLAELDEVLARPKFARWSADGRAAAYVAAFTAGSERHPGLAEVSPSVRDPGGRLPRRPRSRGARRRARLIGSRPPRRRTHGHRDRASRRAPGTAP